MNFTLVPLTPEHLPIVRSWLNKPFIKKYFGEPEEWLTEIAANLDQANWVHYYIAMAPQPIGFCQYYKTDLAPPGIWSAEPPNTVGIDFLIGEPDYIGKGFGKHLLAALLQKIQRNPSTRQIIADPVEDNIVSIALLKHYGFKQKKNGLYHRRVPLDK